MKKTLLMLLGTFLLVGCSGKYIHSAKPTKVVDSYKKSSSSLYFLAKDDLKNSGGKTGFYPLQNNLDAFMARVALIENAKESLNLQYFIYAEDDTALAITKLLLDAADRGVHVRVLIDDLLEKDQDIEIATIAQHPNIEIKLFNPTTFRKTAGWLQMAFNIDTLGRRMHNKLLVADNSAFVIGGRNIENIYFAADKENIFIDNDVLAIGPLASEASNEFETYWNSPVAKRVDEIAFHKTTRKEYEALKEKIQKTVSSIPYGEYIKEAKSRAFYKSVEKKQIPLIYGDAKISFDIPTKIVTSEDDLSSHLSEKISPYIMNAQKSIYIINPYFIPNERFMKTLTMLRKRGVEIHILTNSLATNDGIPVYSAYSRYQKQLVAIGVHLYELNPNAFSYLYKKQTYRKGSIPRSALHAKSMVIDGEIFIVGSANLDPRSIKLNTEVVAVIHSKELAQIEMDVFKNAVAPQNVFRISVEEAPKKECIATCVPQEKTRVVWSTLKDGKEVHYYNDGDAGFWRIVGSNLSVYIPALDKYL
jgi:putative cardiolipin synthase